MATRRQQPLSTDEEETAEDETQENHSAYSAEDLKAFRCSECRELFEPNPYDSGEASPLERLIEHIDKEHNPYGRFVEPVLNE